MTDKSLTELAQRLERLAEEHFDDEVRKAATFLRQFAAAAGELPEEPLSFLVGGQRDDSAVGRAVSKDAYDALRTAAIAARAECASKQAEIDRLMLEFCPDEMTPEQMAEWARNQTAAKERP